MDPVRLARIRARVLAAAATVAVPACGGVPEHVNERPREYVNEAPPDQPPPKEKEVTPINERQPDPPATPDKLPEPKHINTPAPDSTTARLGESADGRDINRPNPDAQPKKQVSVKDIPPSGQTINKAPAAINVVPVPPKSNVHINTPDDQ